MSNFVWKKLLKRTISSLFIASFSWEKDRERVRYLQQHVRFLSQLIIIVVTWWGSTLAAWQELLRCLCSDWQGHPRSGEVWRWDFLWRSGWLAEPACGPRVLQCLSHGCGWRHDSPCRLCWHLPYRSTTCWRKSSMTVRFFFFCSNRRSVQSPWAAGCPGRWWSTWPPPSRRSEFWSPAVKTVASVKTVSLKKYFNSV